MLCMLSNCTKSMMFQKKIIGNFGAKKKHPNHQPKPLPYRLFNHQTTKPPTQTHQFISSLFFNLTILLLESPR